MATNGLYTEDDLEFVKKLLKNGVYPDEWKKRFEYDDEQITAMFRSFMQKKYRVFLGEKQGSQCFVLKDQYMESCGYDDRIKTKSDKLKLLVLADTHFGSKNDNPRIMYKIYNFCKQEGIEHIIHLGDVIEGTEYYVKQICKNGLRISLTSENQLEYLNDNLPYDKDIKVHVLAGNHDMFSNEGVALDVIGELRKEYGRNDILVSGFDYVELPVNSDKLYLNHGYVRDFSQFNYDEESRLYLCGHSHRSLGRRNLEYGYAVEYVTTLSNIDHTNGNHPDEENSFYVGFITLDIEFNENKTFNNIVITRYKTSNSPYSKPKLLPHPEVIEFSRVRK